MEGYTRSSHVRTSIPRSCQPRNYIREYVGALAGGTGAREAASEESQSWSTIRTACPLNHRPIETFAASTFLARLSSRMPLELSGCEPPRVYPGSESRLDGSLAMVGNPEGTGASDRLERAILNHRRRRQRDPRETLDEMPLEGVSSSFFGITCWYRAVTPVTVLYGVAR